MHDRQPLPSTFSGVLVARSLLFCKVLCRSLFVIHLPLFLWRLRCMLFFELLFFLTWYNKVYHGCLLGVAKGTWKKEDNASLLLPDNILYVCLTIPFYNCYDSLICVIGYDKYRILQYFLFKICH